MKKTHYIAVAAAMLISSTAWAGALTIPNTFTAGAPAVAADVNANFTAAKTAVDDNDARITALQNTALVRTINVSPVIGGGGVVDAIASGTALINAVAAITTSSTANPFLVKLEPGVFDLGVQMLSLPDGVSLEGSGQGVTTITSAEPGTINGPYTGTVTALGNNTISHITIKNTDVAVAFRAPQALAVASVTASSVLVENATLLSGGGALLVDGTAAVKVTARHLSLAAVAPARMVTSINPNAVVLVSHSSQSGVVVGYIAPGGTGSLQCFSVFNEATLAVVTAACQ